MSAVPSNAVAGKHAGQVRRPAQASPAAAYMNPYVAGVGLGLVLLASFVIMGRGLGATGAFSSFIAWIAQMISPEHVDANTVYSDYLGDEHPLKAWLVFLVAGAFVGAMISGLMARRFGFAVDKGPRIATAGPRGYAVRGGARGGIGAQIARGGPTGPALLIRI